MESSSNHMACLLKIESSTSGWEKSLEKLLKSINDVSFMIDKQNKTVYVSGKIDPQTILEKITKSGKNAVLVWSDYGQNKQQENLQDGQCYASGYMNAPNGLPTYPYNHCSYPPPNYWMNQAQPHHPTFAPPPPYPRQLHPQPTAPPPYMFHQNEPVPKSFPPTPPPPKNFTMGDLQFGCRIM